MANTQPAPRFIHVDVPESHEWAVGSPVIGFAGQTHVATAQHGNSSFVRTIDLTARMSNHDNRFESPALQDSVQIEEAMSSGIMSSGIPMVFSHADHADAIDSFFAEAPADTNFRELG